MPIHQDFSVSADNLLWIGPSHLLSLGGGAYQTPDKFYENTLLVMYRGLPLAKENDDGYEVLNDQVFKLKESNTNVLDWYMVGYIKKPF